jgi:hypothetical protein
LKLARVRRSHSWHSFIRSLQLSWQTLHLTFGVNPKERYWPFFKSFYKGEEEEPFCWQTLHLPFGMKPKEVMLPSFNLKRLRNLSIWQKQLHDIVEAYIKNIHNLE